MPDFLSLIRANGIKCVADVRAFPGSRRYPHFGKDQLAAALEAAGIHYIHIVSLGGRRRAVDLPAGVEHDTHWRNPAFSAYADYTKTEPFRVALDELETVAKTEPTAIMCAEALWWKCHRRLIAEELTKDGFEVTHILGGKHKDAAEAAPTLPGL